MAGMGTTDSPTPADDLAELRAYADKGPAVSRATCARIADRLAAEATEPPPTYGIPLFAMLDLWMALGGEPAAFDRMLAEDRRTPGDTWSQLLAIARGIPWAVLVEGDTNPPPGPEIESLIEQRADAQPATTVLWEQETKPSDGDPAKSYIAPPLLDCPPGTSVVVVQGPLQSLANPPAFDPDGFDADALVMILGLADLDPLDVLDRCKMCGAEAPGGATTLAMTQHRGDCLWVSARELAEVVRGGPKTP